MGNKWIKRLSLGLLVMLLALTGLSHFGFVSPMSDNFAITASASAQGVVSISSYSQKRSSQLRDTINNRTTVTADLLILENNSPPIESESKPAWKKIFPKLKPITKPATNPKNRQTSQRQSKTSKNRQPPPTNTVTACTERIQIKLIYNNKSFEYTDKKLEPTNHLVAQEFHNKKINSSYTEKKLIMNQCLASGSTYKFAVLFSMPLLERVVDEAIKAAHKEAKDSKIIFKPCVDPMFNITKEAAGYKVDEERLYKDIYFSLLAYSSIKIELHLVPIQPKITTKDNIELTNLRAKHSTSFIRSGEDRSHNIKLALKKINGKRLDAGEIFSFNNVVGKRTKERGFKEGNIIVSGKYQKGTGGGVCQVSTTLYNAALLSGMDILVVKNHSLECSYELPSFDAMVSSSQDLKFKNSGEKPVFIKAFAKDGRAIIEIYGAEMQYKLSRTYEIVHRKDPPPINRLIDTDYKYHNIDAESGEQKVINYPRGELKSFGYLVYHDLDGNFIKKVKIRQDVYKASEGLMAIAP